MLTKEYDFVIGRPHDHLPLGHYQGYINRKEADAAENLVRSNAFSYCKI